MSSGLLRSTLLGLLGVTLVSACTDDVDTTTQSAGGDGSRIYRSDAGPLTAPSATQATQVLRDFLATRVGPAADQLAVVTQSAPVNGVSHVRLEQTVGGLRVHGAYVKAAITDAGELVQVIEKLAPASGLPRAATLKHKDALGAAMKELGYDFATPAQTSANGQKLGFARGTEFHREPSVERVAYLDENGALRQGYLVETWSQRGNQLDHTLVGGDGKIVSTERRTNNESYNVFVEDPGPGKGGQTVVSGTSWLDAGSHKSQHITGNNAQAYLDATSDNVPDGGGSVVSDGNFLSTANLAISAGTGEANRNVAVQNLFYLNNRIHDVLYQHGFNEAAGNFQETNFGNGGLGSDSVNAEAQDGGGLDNANFATPTDGSNPRMQMYLWSGTTPPNVATVGGTDYGAWGSSFGPAITTKTGALAAVNDGVAGVGTPAGTLTDGCEALPAGTLTGKIAVVDRGFCAFTVKVRNAQAAGAVGVLIANTTAGASFSPGGTDRKVKIPSAMVSQADGATLRAAVPASATLRVNPTPAVRIDGDLDSDIVFHEYGHGLTWRMIGSMSGPLAGAIGEGMADFLAMLLNDDDRIGEYSFSDPLGIRRYPYANYPLTYAGMASGEVHNDGELYGAIGWDLMQRFGATRREALFGYVINGMNFTSPSPAYEHMRDGILAAIGTANTADRCLVWSAFARYGVGVGASGVVTQGGRAVKITESFVKGEGCP
ncbi:MAG: M36 family metallopeptidase [Deltaproteobacteria bacterium]|nr:M36 family metallopeptidase [Deltaproteobacteria bacterium]